MSCSKPGLLERGEVVLVVLIDACRDNKPLASKAYEQP